MMCRARFLLRGRETHIDGGALGARSITRSIFLRVGSAGGLQFVGDGAFPERRAD